MLDKKSYELEDSEDEDSIVSPSSAKNIYRHTVSNFSDFSAFSDSADLFCKKWVPYSWMQWFRYSFIYPD